MKLFVVALLITSAFSAFAKGIEGQYAANKSTMVWSTSKEDCLADKGSWMAEDEVCELPVQDTVEIKKMGSKYKLQISTLGNNLHMCEFEGTAKLTGVGKLISKVKTEEYIYETGKLGKVECEVTVFVTKSGVMTVSNNGHCQSFCGANAWLEATGLTKVKQ